MEANIAEEPQATDFKDAELVASSWTIKAYQSFRRVQTAGWWSARCVPLQAGLHFKVTHLNLIQYHLQNEITLSAIKNRLHLPQPIADLMRPTDENGMWLTTNEAVGFRWLWSSHTGPVRVSAVSQLLYTVNKIKRQQQQHQQSLQYRSEVGRSYFRFGISNPTSVGHQDYGLMVPKFLLE